MTRGSRMLASAAVLALFLAPAALAAQEPELSAEERAAVEASEAWLALIDTDRFEDSWNAAAPVFQSALTAEMWVQQGQAVRQQVGEPRGRTLRTAEHTTSLPNAPAGEYVVVTYPVLVGGGTPFFAALDTWVYLNLVETRTFPDGVLLARYETRR